MARIDKVAYRNMIEALKNAAKNISANAENMKSLSDSCAAALGDEDVGAQQLTSQMNESVTKYLQAAEKAVDIAKKMQEELTRQEQEDSVWTSD